MAYASEMREGAAPAAPSAGALTAPLPCGCIPYGPVRCAEALRLRNVHARASKAAGRAYRGFLHEMTPRARGELVAARRREVETWERYSAHLDIDDRDVPLLAARTGDQRRTARLEVTS